MSDNKVTIQIDFDNKDIKAETSQVEKSFKKSGKRSADLFSSQFNSGLSASIKRLGSVAAKATALIGGVASALVGIKSIRAAQEQEDAVNSLNSALSITQNAGLQASQSIQTFASELQKTTRFGDELLIQNAALIQSLGDLDEQGLKRATRAAADLATALRIDLGTAATLVGKAAAGEVGTFSRYGLSIQKASDNTKTFANALDAIEKKFGGAAQRDVVTFSGAVDQLSNSFSDTLESIGRFAAKSPEITLILKDLTESTNEATKSIDESRKTFEIVPDLLRPALASIAFLNRTFVGAGESLFSLSESILRSLKLIFVDSLNFIVASTTKGVGQVLNIISDGLGNKLVQKSDEALLEIEDNFDQIGASFSNVFEQKFTDSVENSLLTFDEYLVGLQQRADEINRISEEQENTNILRAQTNAEQVKSIYGEVFNGLTSGLEGVGESTAEANKAIESFGKKSGKQLQQGFGRAAAQAFSTFGAALAEGNASLSSFTDALFKQIAQSAVTLGTNFILEGTAYLFTTNPDLQANGPQLISAGAALATFGGALGAVAGGGSSASAGASSPTTATGGEPAGVPVQEVPGDPETIEQAQEQSSVTINIDRFVGDEEEARRVADILSDAGAKNGTLLTNVRSFA